MITQGLPDSKDILLDDLGVHIRLRPKGLEYFILRYEPVRVLDRFHQNHGLRRFAHRADGLVVPLMADEQDRIAFASTIA